ncbi:MAG: DUF4832 domain-containing protein [Prevotella sp.]|nr:DUF4832 domain-containing protein [Prevotella sp.]MBQ7748344.1 DUF4832 domain-containing protein [Paludibacteraceae bacterium]MBR0498161.1 DUF4832 domain-containing protein [Paludibacteraceae bacterium]
MKKHLLTSLLVASAFLVNAQMRNVKLQSEITTLEPMKGIVFWPDLMAANPELNSSISLEFSYCLPCKVVTGKVGDKLQYDWSSFEAFLNDVASRGHQAIVRFRYEYPGSDGKITDAPYCTCNQAGATAVPLYIKNGSYSYGPEYYKTVEGDGLTYYADWTNDELKWFTKQFYTDFAAKYDNDPRIAFVQVGFGHWSEYHIYDDNGLPSGWKGKYFPSDAYQTEFLKHVANQFKNTPWSVSIDAADDSYCPITTDESLMALNFGLFDDSFMHSEHDIAQGDGWNETEWIAMGTDRWKSAPGGGEISYYTDEDQHNFLNPAGMYGVTWEQAAKKYHMTYVIGNNALEGSYASAARLKQAGNNAGYSFQITKYQVSSTDAVVTVKNNGVAPIYHDAYVTVKGVRSTTSLKGLIPGESRECTVTGLTIGSNEAPTLTITSDKLLAGVTIPYAASLDGTGLSAPTISLSASSVTVKPNTEVTVTATVSSENGDITSVVFKKNGTEVATVTSAPYTYTFTPTEVGTYTITAVVTDEVPLQTESDALVIKCEEGPAEDFETLQSNAVTGSTGVKLNTGNFRDLGDILIEGNTWNLTQTRLGDGASYNHTAGGSKSLRIAAQNTGFAITPLLKGKQTVTFYARLYNANKAGSLSVYSSADNYTSPVKTQSFSASHDWALITVELNSSSDVKLKIVNTTTSSGTDYSVLLDDFSFALSTGAATAVNDNANVKLIEQRGSKLYFGGENFEVIIYSAATQKVASTSESVFDLAALPVGVYVVRYVGDNGSAVQKVVR